MEISISNIAWETTDDLEVYALLIKHKVKYIDIAPPKYFKSPSTVTVTEIQNTRNWWQNKGINIAGMQSLLFGTQGMNVFSDKNTQNKMLNHLKNICHIGEHLKAPYLVFGSPRNRDISGLNKVQVEQCYLDFFNQLGDIAASHNTVICLEPNPKEYGANFMTNSHETADVVRHIAHPNIAMQLDTGAIFMNNEDPNKIIESYWDIIGHIHISEPKLAPVGSLDSLHDDISSSIKKYLPSKVCTIEMLSSSGNNTLKEIDTALAFTMKHYGNSI